MEEDPYILAIARALSAQLGPDAAAQTQRRADEHTKAGEMEGADLWRRVALAIAELQNTRSG